jgi:hypothetical protein
LAALLVGAALLASACAGRSISRSDAGADDDVIRGGDGGTIDRGGTSGTGGKGGTGGTTPPTGGFAGTTFPEGGTSGTIGTSGSGGASGSGGFPPTCTSGGGPLGTPSARRTIPFLLTPGAGGAGGAPGNASDLELSGAGGAGGELDGCEPLAYGYECIGDARATTTGGRLVFTFNDGSNLTWTGSIGTFVGQPRVIHGESVFITYQHETPPVCPFCGNSSETLIEISRRAEIIWYGVEGSRLEELNVNVVRFLLGASYRRSEACVMPPFAVDCYVVERELYDVVLQTVPEQWIRHATPTVVSTPEGEFEVMWASSEQLETRQNDCDDGRLPARDRGFAMSRL